MCVSVHIDDAECFVSICRLSELRDVLVELRNKQEHETQERRIVEQSSQLKSVIIYAFYVS